MYILTITAKRKNAKRHVVKRGEDLEYLRYYGETFLSNRYIVEVYDGKWTLIKRIK